MAHGFKTSYMDFINWYWDQRVYTFSGNTTNVSEECFCRLVIKDNGGTNCWNVFVFNNSCFKRISIVKKDTQEAKLSSIIRTGPKHFFY